MFPFEWLSMPEPSILGFHSSNAYICYLLSRALIGGVTRQYTKHTYYIRSSNSTEVLHLFVLFFVQYLLVSTHGAKNGIYLPSNIYLSRTK